jgi:hypothetical protein
MLFDEGVQPTGDAGIKDEDEDQATATPPVSDGPAAEGDDTQTV